MADSCGIFLINIPCSAKLHKGISHLHADDEEGIAWKQAEGYGDLTITPGGYHVFEKSGGPGMPLSTYLPKAEDLCEKLRPSLTGQPRPEGLGLLEAIEATDGNANEARSGGRAVLKTNEKRLEVELYKYKGEIHKGSHFPICVFTSNPGRRSLERYEGRATEAQARKGGGRGRGGPGRGGQGKNWGGQGDNSDNAWGGSGSWGYKHRGWRSHATNVYSKRPLAWAVRLYQ